jgi:hypothetical protein
MEVGRGWRGGALLCLENGGGLGALGEALRCSGNGGGLGITRLILEPAQCLAPTAAGLVRVWGLGAAQPTVALTVYGLGRGLGMVDKGVAFVVKLSPGYLLNGL